MKQKKYEFNEKLGKVQEIIEEVKEIKDPKVGKEITLHKDETLKFRGEGKSIVDLLRFKFKKVHDFYISKFDYIKFKKINRNLMKVKISSPAAPGSDSVSELMENSTIRRERY